MHYRRKLQFLQNFSNLHSHFLLLSRSSFLDLQAKINYIHVPRTSHIAHRLQSCLKRAVYIWYRTSYIPHPERKSASMAPASQRGLAPSKDSHVRHH
jgi:hypothetical protein